MLPLIGATRLVAILLCCLNSFALSNGSEPFLLAPVLNNSIAETNQPPQQQEKEEHALMAMSDNIRQAIRYIDAMSTPDGDTEIYDAFFHGVTPTKVKAVLASALRGGPTYHSRHTQTPVTFICVLYGNQAMADDIRDCQRRAVRAWHTPYSHFIFLCQVLLFQAQQPTPKDCAEYSRRRKLLLGSKIQSTQTALLLHELMHLMLGEVSFESEVYNVNKVVKLGPAKSAINAANYAYFVGNVVAGCDEFPPRKPSAADEGLL
ncbi:MAG: hypothetical protein Q9184_004327 [Pyrenodesmia sp. 2 TL-2023]